MGNNQSTGSSGRAHSKDGASTNGNGVHAQGSTQEAQRRSKRYSIRSSKRVKITSSTTDTRNIKVSRGSERPRVAANTLWEDPVFPREMAMEGSRMEGMNYRWMRPKEFCEKPMLASGKPCRHDVIQGTIGNCWMMALLAGIADDLPHLLHIVGSTDYDPSSSSYDGVFLCRFWHFGQWVDIYIDDCLPVRYNPGAPKKYSLLGAKSPDPNVLWVALVEKALAKFHGSYRSIEAREREYGWRLLTGGVPTILDQQMLRRTAADDLFSRIKLAVDMGCVVTCSHIIPGDRLHAYTITGAAKHSAKGNIIRIRNPWGEEKQHLSWLQRATPEGWTYSETERKEMFECKAGEFWVLRGECFRQFDQFCIGCFKAEFYDEKEKTSMMLDHKFSFYGEWKGDKAAGNQLQDLFHNPKYEIKVSGSRLKKKKVFLELIPRPIEANKGVSMYIYKIQRLKQYKATLCQEYRSESDKHVFLANGCPQYSYSLSPGVYMVVPLTQSQSDEREFCLRVFAKSCVSCRELSGTFFHRDDYIYTIEESNETLKYQHYPGQWKKDLYVNDDTISPKLKELTQYHITVSVETQVSLLVSQEYTKDAQMNLKMYKFEGSLNQAIDQSAVTEARPQMAITPTGIRSPKYKCQCTLQPDHTYVLLLFPWCMSGENPRHFVMSVGSEQKAKLKIRSFNT